MRGAVLEAATVSTAHPPVAGRSDHQLVSLVRAGDDRAFEELFERYRRRITAYVYGMVSDHGRAEDITQEVFVSALRRMRETERPIAFRPWIYEIAKNACIDAFRRRSRAEEVSLTSDDGLDGGDHLRLVSSTPAPEETIEVKQRLDHLCGAFGGLSDAHHEILVLRELEGLSYREIGERMGLSRAGGREHAVPGAPPAHGGVRRARLGRALHARVGDHLVGRCPRTAGRARPAAHGPPRRALPGLPAATPGRWAWRCRQRGPEERGSSPRCSRSRCWGAAARTRARRPCPRRARRPGRQRASGGRAGGRQLGRGGRHARHPRGGRVRRGLGRAARRAGRIMGKGAGPGGADARGGTDTRRETSAAAGAGGHAGVPSLPPPEVPLAKAPDAPSAPKAEAPKVDVQTPQVPQAPSAPSAPAPPTAPSAACPSAPDPPTAARSADGARPAQGLGADAVGTGHLRRD